jgi:hypothetical protein
VRQKSVCNVSKTVSAAIIRNELVSLIMEAVYETLGNIYVLPRMTSLEDFIELMSV